MNPDNRLDELLAKVEGLQHDIGECREEIRSLKNQIAELHRTKKTNPVSQKTGSFTFENFVGLKLIHFVGIIVLIIGLTIGVKYAIDIDLISPALRIMLAYIAGLVLFLIAVKLRKKYELFSIILFSGAVASAYFTTYGAYAYYGMIPGFAAFGIMLLLTFFTVYNALKYNRAEIAILGLAGAYCIPFFVRGNNDNISALLYYILLINGGVLFLSFKKYWLSLNYAAFLSTWVIYAACVYADSDAGNFTNVLVVFGFVFFVLFTLSSLGFKLVKKWAVDSNDVLLICLNTLFLYAALTILFARTGQMPAGYLSLFFALGLLPAGFASARFLKAQPLLSSSIWGMGICALAIFIAMRFEGFTITIMWVLCAILLFVAGMLARLKIFRVAAIFLFAATIIKLLLWDSDHFSAIQKIIAYVLTGVVLLVVSFLYQRFKSTIFGEIKKDA